MKGKCIYIALISVVHARRSGSGSHSFTCNYTNVCLYFVSIHQMTPPRLMLRTSNCSLLLIYLPQKDERLSWPCWLTYSEQFTHVSGHPSAVGRAHDRESFASQRPTFYHSATQPTIEICLFTSPAFAGYSFAPTHRGMAQANTVSHPSRH